MGKWQKDQKARIVPQKIASINNHLHPVRVGQKDKKSFTTAKTDCKGVPVSAGVVVRSTPDDDRDKPRRGEGKREEGGLVRLS